MSTRFGTNSQGHSPTTKVWYIWDYCFECIFLPERHFYTKHAAQEYANQLNKEDERRRNEHRNNPRRRTNEARIY